MQGTVWRETPPCEWEPCVSAGQESSSEQVSRETPPESCERERPPQPCEWALRDAAGQEIPDPAERKKFFRRLLLERRRLLSPEYRRESDEGIFYRVKSLKAYEQAKVIFCYVSADGEVDTGRLIKNALEAGKRVTVPLCERGRKGIMTAREIRSLSDLVPGAFGIPEPSPECPEVDPSKLDFCVVPCVSVSRAGVRLGYGGGYYDRYLGLVRAFQAVLCREKMICDELTGEPHDRMVDALVTENSVTFYRRNDHNLPAKDEI